jgi:chemotaxis protein methyltransferase CheR
MNEIEFSYLRDLLHKRSGLLIGVDKRYLVESRLAVVCRQNGIASLSALTGLLRAGAESLATAVVEAMTTNETLFFRDTLPFRQVRELMLPHLMKARSTDRTLRIWCAAASSGQEPYSLAMMLDGMASQLKGWKIEILATDISEDILAKAQAGIYSQFEVQRGLPIQSLLRHFTQHGERWHLNERIRNMVTFRQHNLVSQQAGSGPLGRFDIIFCRNVMIYFDVPTKSRVLDLLARHIRPDGFLCLGSAETVIGLSDAFTVNHDNRGVYRPAGGKAGSPQTEPRRASLGIIATGHGQPAPMEPARPASPPALSLVGGSQSRT